MKKWLSIFTMTVLTLTTSTNIIACNNSNVPIPTINTVKFKLMNGIKEATSLAIDSKNNLYTSDKNGNIYKCLAGKNEFKKFATTKTEHQTIIKIDNNDNIYVIVNSKIYKCLEGENTFQKIYDFNENIWSIFIDKNNNIYTGSSSGRLYKCLADKTNFNEIENIQRPISSIVIDKNDNIFLLSTIIQQDSKIYKCLTGKTDFNKIWSINDVYAGGKLALDSNNNIYIWITKINGKGDFYKCLAGKNTFNQIAKMENGLVNFILDKNNNIYALDNAKNVYQILSNDKDIHVINNQLFINNNTIITDQENKVYISNSDYEVYESY